MEDLTKYDFFGMSEKELKAALAAERKKTQQLAKEATKELHNWGQNTKTLNIKVPKIDANSIQFNGDLRSSFIAAISEEQRKQSLIKLNIAKIKSGNLSFNDIKNLDFVAETSNIGMTKGEGAQDKYARVMENVSNAADIREEWDSTDVLKIDDIAIEQSISYDKAKEIVEKQKAKGTPAKEVLGEGDDEV